MYFNFSFTVLPIVTMRIIVVLINEHDDDYYYCVNTNKYC